MHKTLTPNFEILSQLPGLFFWEKDLNSTFVGGSAEFSKSMGRFKNPQEILGMNDCDFFDGVIPFMYQAQDKEVASTKNPLRIFDIIKSTKMEKPKICITVKTPKFNKNKIVIGTMGYSVDVTDSFIKVGHFLTKTHWENSEDYNVQGSYTITEKAPGAINLAPRESECLFFLLRNRSAKEIAKILNLSPRTIEFYIENIKLKFNARSKSELFDKAIEHGFFNVIPDRILSKKISIILGKI